MSFLNFYTTPTRNRKHTFLKWKLLTRNQPKIFRIKSQKKENLYSVWLERYDIYNRFWAIQEVMPTFDLATGSERSEGPFCVN